MIVRGTVFLGNSVTAHIVKISRILWNPNFANFEGFLFLRRSWGLPFAET
jgi:hypothetical protein